MDEMWEEPVWEESHRLPKTQMKNQHVWEGEIGLRQMKDWINRGTNTRWRTSKWRRWANLGSGIQSMGGENGFKRDLRKLKLRLSTLENQITQRGMSSFAAKERVAYFTAKTETSG